MSELIEDANKNGVTPPQLLNLTIGRNEYTLNINDGYYNHDTIVEYYLKPCKIK